MWVLMVVMTIMMRMMMVKHGGEWGWWLQFPDPILNTITLYKTSKNDVAQPWSTGFVYLRPLYHRNWVLPDDPHATEPDRASLMPRVNREQCDTVQSVSIFTSHRCSVWVWLRGFEGDLSIDLRGFFQSWSGLCTFSIWNLSDFLIRKDDLKNHKSLTQNLWSMMLSKTRISSFWPLFRGLSEVFKGCGSCRTAIWQYGSNMLVLLAGSFNIGGGGGGGGMKRNLMFRLGGSFSIP